MCVGGVGPGLLKVVNNLDLILVGDGEPRAQLGKNFEGRLLVAPHVFLVEGIDVMLVNVCDNCLDIDLADDLLVYETRPHGHLLLLKFDEVSALRRRFPSQDVPFFYMPSHLHEI